ncbi:hypothetical protein [Lysinibacillus sp. NPDC047702]|uniref:hypothetical protein n=1 Tax=unclassified Lysinibacillus TaxID=2636778 RepID=UPI003CFCDFB3
MEQLIIFAIIAIVSSIFGKSKTKKEHKQMPPFNKGSHAEPTTLTNAEEAPSQRPVVKSQSFEDFAREFLGEWKNNEPKVEQTKKIVEEKGSEEVPSYVAPPIVPIESVSRASNRQSIGRLVNGKNNEAGTQSHSAFQLPNSKKSLMQAIVMAEILGPPKAKRK